MPLKPPSRFTGALCAILSLLAVAVLPALARAEPVRIVGLGDSLMAGYELGPEEGFAPVLQRELDELGYDVEVIGAGVSGDTSTGGLARLDWSVPADADIVIVELGGNDALRGIDPGLTRSNLDAIVTKLTVAGKRVVLAGMLAPPNMGAGYESAFNPIFAEIAESRDVPLYPFFLEGAITVPGMMLEDGIHPNATGVEAMVEGFLPTLLPVIEAVIDARGADGHAGVGLADELTPGPGTQPPVDPAVPAAPATQ